MKAELVMDDVDTKKPRKNGAHSVPMTYNLAMFCMEERFVLFHKGQYGIIALLFEQEVAFLYVDTGEIKTVPLGELTVTLSLSEAQALLEGNLIELPDGWRFAWWDSKGITLTELCETAESAILHAAFEIGGVKGEAAAMAV